MTTFLPAYRLTVYAPRSVDPTEATVLTPVAGAPHSDSFQVTTLPTLAGWKPYLYFPDGRTGKIDVLARTTDIGTVTVILLDPRLSAGDNLTRWLTAYFGNLKGEYRAGGLRSKLEESLTLNADGTRTDWASWFTGRLQKVRSAGKSRFALEIQDEASELIQRVFVGRPHSSITYAGVMSLAPIGLTAPFGTIPAVTPFTGSCVPYVLGGFTIPRIAVALDASQVSRPDMLATSNLIGAGAPVTAVGIVTPGSGGSLADFSGPVRARLTHTSGANAGLTGDYHVGYLGFFPPDRNGHFHLGGFGIQALPTAELNYLALPAVGVTVQGYLLTG